MRLNKLSSFKVVDVDLNILTRLPSISQSEMSVPSKSYSAITMKEFKRLRKQLESKDNDKQLKWCENWFPIPDKVLILVEPPFLQVQA